MAANDEVDQTHTSTSSESEEATDPSKSEESNKPQPNDKSDTLARSTEVLEQPRRPDASKPGFHQRGGKSEDANTPKRRLTQSSSTALSKEERNLGEVAARHWLLYFKSIGVGLWIACLLRFVAVTTSCMFVRRLLVGYRYIFFSFTVAVCAVTV